MIELKRSTNPDAAPVRVDAAVDVIVVGPEDARRQGDRVGSILGPALREGQEVYAA